MTSVRRLVWLMLMLLLSPATSLAAPEKRPERSKPDQFQGMTSLLLLEIDKRLNLSGEQKSRIVDLKKEFEDKHRDAVMKLREEAARIRHDMDSARTKKDGLAMKRASDQLRELRRNAEKLRAEFEQKLLDVLTDEQKKQYADIKKDLSRPDKVPLSPEKKSKP